MLDFYILFILLMQNNYVKKRGITLMILGGLFLIISGIFYLVKWVLDEGFLSTGIMFLVMGTIMYFITSKRVKKSDEMSKKIGYTSRAVASQIILCITAIFYFVNTRWLQLEIATNTLFSIYIFGSIAIALLSQYYYSKHIEKIPF